MTQNAIWLFDSVCVLCDGAVQYTLRHEKAATIRFISIQSDTGRELAKVHGIDPDDPTTFLFIDNGRALAKSDGVLALAQHLNGIARFAGTLRLIPRPIRDYTYDVIARNRYRLFGKRDSCIAPSPENNHRFILS